jgi:hypothetical protein
MREQHMGEIAEDLLAETIQKGQRSEALASMSRRDLKKALKALPADAPERADLKRHLRRREGGDTLKKALSFDPARPHEMTAESSYHNPYMQLGDGSFAPHPVAHWMGQAGALEPEALAQMECGYSEVARFYRAAGVQKGGLYGEIDTLVKAIPKSSVPKPTGAPSGRALPVGTVHTWNGMQYRKKGPNEWVPVHEGPEAMHPIEQDHRKKTTTLSSILSARKYGLKPEPGLDDRARVATQKAKDLEAQGGEHSERDQKLRDADHEKRTEQADTREKDIDAQKQHLEKVTKDAPLEHQFCGEECQAGLQEKTKRQKPGEGGNVDLTKAELAEILKTGKYALISAGKNPNHAEDSQLDDNTVNARYQSLEGDLKTDGFTYTKVKGHYGGEEDSFLVMIHDADKAHVTKLGEKYNQDSVIYSDAGKHEMLYTTGKNKGSKHDGSGFEEKADAEDYYTEISHAGGGGKSKFSLKFDFDSLTPAVQKTLKSLAWMKSFAAEALMRYARAGLI